jgi:ATP synthase protein I
MGRFKDIVEKTSYMTVGLQFVIAVLLGIAFGYYLDRLFDTFPALTLLWLMIGFLAGLKNLYRELKKVAR